MRVSEKNSTRKLAEQASVLCRFCAYIKAMSYTGQMHPEWPEPDKDPGSSEYVTY
jgi:hypothetical protein